MAMLEGESKKATFLYSSHAFIRDIDRFQSPAAPGARHLEGVKRYTDKSGVSRICGGKDLKGTQAYPLGFGRAIEQLMRLRAVQLRQEAEQARLRNRRVPPNVPRYFHISHLMNRGNWWAESGNLDIVLQYLPSRRASVHGVLDSLPWEPCSHVRCNV